jgi:hypothetical protein
MTGIHSIFVYDLNESGLGHINFFRGVEIMYDDKKNKKNHTIIMHG